MPPLVRTRRGSVIHRANCIQVLRGQRSTCLPWIWAAGRERAEVLEFVRFNRYTECRECLPLNPAEDWIL